MSVDYNDILESVRNLIVALPGIQEGSTAVSIYNEPGWNPALHKLRHIIVAPRLDLSEDFGEAIMSNSVMLLYEVYVGILTEQTFSEELRKWRAARRREIRLALWKPTVLTASIPEMWSIEYQPKPAITPRMPPESEGQVLGTWMGFIYGSVEAREV